MYTAARCFIPVVAVAGLVACGTNITDVNFEASESFLFEVGPVTAIRLTVENINGAVRVTGDPATSVVVVQGERRVGSDTRADAEEFLDRVTVEVVEQGNQILARTQQPNSTNGRQVVVDYDVIVPSQMDVRVTNINGEVDVESLDSSVRVENINGGVSVVDVVGDVEVGLINGGIDADVTLLPDGLVDLAVVNGSVRLDVPSSVSAMLEADAVNGTISVVGLTVTEATTTNRSVHGKLGGGNGLIDLGTTNGTITVRGR